MISISEIESAVGTWAAETRAILQTAAYLAEFFGSEEEENALRESLRVPLAWVEITELAARRLETPNSELGPLGMSQPASFDCGERLAAILSPLFQLLVVPVPEFVDVVRRSLSPSEQKIVTIPFGQFVVLMRGYVCKPLWGRFPSYAPEGWPP